VDQRVAPSRRPARADRAEGGASDFLSEGFSAGFDESEPARRGLGPGDSHYELSFALRDPVGDSGVDWPAVSADDPQFGESPSGEFVEAFGREVDAREPQYYRFIDSSGRFLFFGTLIFIIVSLPLFGFLLVHILGGGPAVNPAPLALIVGTIAAIAFLFISLGITALNVLLVDLARNIRRLRDHADQKAGIVRG
jgi:hypothetical protein